MTIHVYSQIISLYSTVRVSIVIQDQSNHHVPSLLAHFCGLLLSKFQSQSLFPTQHYETDRISYQNLYNYIIGL